METPKPIPFPSDSPNFLSADDILNADDLDYVDVTVPEWKKNGKPGVIRFRAMTAGEAIKFTKEITEEKSDDSYVKVVAATAIDPASGERLFKGDSAVEQLKRKKSGIFIRLQKAVMKLNNIGKDNEDNAKNG
jgi:hypothetical protein